MYQMHTRRKLITTAAVTCWVTRLGRAGMPCLRGGGRMPAFAVIAALAALAVPGVPHSAAAASSPVLNWVKQAPATRPHARYLASMAYDAATRTVVLFGGANPQFQLLGDTWTWGLG